MNKKLGKRSFAALAGTMVVAGPVLAACSPGPTYDQWAATDGAAGRINLEAVQDAFKKSKSVSEFEGKVNEIYEGDGIILIRARQDGENLTLQAYEDLNKNGDIDGETGDDLLFEIVQSNGNNEMRGHGANSYYPRSSFGAGNFLFTYLLISSFSRGPYFYQTSPARASTIRNSRTSYRNSTSYRSQVSRNGSYFNKQKSFAGSRYSDASRNVSPARQTYQSSQKTSGAFKSSGTGVRSSWGSGSRSSRGGFGSSRGGGGRGFGGSQVVIGFKRG